MVRRKKKPRVCCFGAGRMGRGIAICFAFAGYQVALIDSRHRKNWIDFKKKTSQEISETFTMMASFDMLNFATIPVLLDRISYIKHEDASEALSRSNFIFEAVPETEEAKRVAFNKIEANIDVSIVVASTTSTFLPELIAKWCVNPERIINAHFLNPAYLVPVVEVSPNELTVSEAMQNVKELLEDIGKIPIVCKASPGYIIPRIQALAMNEAARMVEEGIASPEEIDKAIINGFGLRFSVLGLLEFIDWGGGDILYHASNYLKDATGEKRFSPPDIIKKNMKAGNLGISSGRGIYNYKHRDIEKWKAIKLGEFANILKTKGLLPKPVL